MKKNKLRYHNHLVAYGVLVVILLTGLLAFIKVGSQTQKQLQVAALTSLSYFVWGVVHHAIDRDLHWKVVIEYVSFALLGYAMLWVLLVLLA